jgi:protoporphyrinogen oxidase
LTYRAFIVVVLIINRTELFPDNWIYVHSPEVKVGRIQNLNNWGRDLVSRPGVTCLEMEYFCDRGDSLWRMDDEDLLKLAKTELESLTLAKVSEVLEGCVVREDKAYPVYNENYQKNVKSIRHALDRIENLQIAGRNGMHKYNNQDHSMLTGKLAAENLAQTGSRRRFDVWRVNTDAEYLEEEEKPSPAASR